MTVYTTPGVYFEPVDPAGAGITALRTDIAAFIGIAERGPLHRPQRVRSWEQFAATFGGFIRCGYLAYAAKAFFENGGQILYGVRVAAPVASAQASGAQPADRGSSIVDSADGFVAGAVVTIRQDATTVTAGPQPASRSASVVASVDGFPSSARVRLTQPAPAPQPRRSIWRTVQLADATTNQLAWEQPLDPAFDLTQPITLTTGHRADQLLADVAGTTLTWATPLSPAFALGQPIRFETGAAAASATVLDETGEPRLRIEALDPGVWGNGVAVHIGRASPAATRTSAAAQTAERSSVETVTGFAVGSLVKVYQDPHVTHRVVTAVDPSRKALTWDAALPVTFNLGQPIAFETLVFSLGVVAGGQTREVFADLSLVPGAERYVGKVWAADKAPSTFIRVTDLTDLSAPPAAQPSWPGRLPDPTAPNLRRGLLPLRAGRDGVAALRPEHFTGDLGAEQRRGLRTLEQVDEAAIVAIPDILIQPAPARASAPPPPPIQDPCVPAPCSPPEASAPGGASPGRIEERTPGFSLDEVFRVQSALVAHCETLKDRIALLDPPLFSRRGEDTDIAEIQTWRQQFDSRYAALYMPWVLVYDPLRDGAAGDLVRAIPPSGHVAGIYARTDLQTGVHKAPANVELAWAQGLAATIDPAAQGILNPLGINCLRAFPGRGLRVYGARTVSNEGLWRYVNVRRLLMMIEEALDKSSQWAVFEPNNYVTRRTLASAISSFLTALWGRGALVGAVAEESFFVQCDEINNPSFVADQGRLIVDVGVAPVKPAEFVVFRLGRLEDVLELTEAGGTT